MLRHLKKIVQRGHLFPLFFAFISSFSLCDAAENSSANGNFLSGVHTFLNEHNFAVLVIAGVFLLFSFGILFLSFFIFASRKPYAKSVKNATISARNEFKIKDTTQLLSIILESIPCSIFLKNYSDNGRYLFSNKQFRDFIGYKGDSIVGLLDKDIFPESIAKKYVADDMNVIESGKLIKTIEDVPFADGTMGVSHTTKTVIPTQDGDKYLVGIALDVTDLAKTQNELKSYIEQERIVNECLRIVLRNDESEIVVNEVLKTIGEQMHADRCYIFEYDDKSAEINNTFEWCANLTIPQKDSLKNLPDSNVEEWTREFRKRNIVYTNDLVSDTTEQFKSARPVLERQDIKALIVAGIWQRGKLWGFVGVDFVKNPHRFTEIDKNMIESASNILELYLNKRRSMEILEQSELQKSLILESVQIPVMLFDSEGILIDVNSAGVKIVSGNKSKEEILSEPCYVNYCGGRLFDSNCPVKRCIKSGKTESVELNMNGRDFLISASPVLDKNGKIINVIKSCVDLTEIYESKREIEKAMEAAKAADRAKSLFLATISHELRTPLNSVIGFSELSQNDEIDNAERIENLKNINFSANALLNLVNDVLDISRLEAGQMEIVKAPMDMHSLSAEIAGIFKFRAKKQGISISVYIPSNFPILMLDSLRIKQVLLNVVGNAVKFTDKGGVEIFFSFEAENDKRGNLKIKVSDTGMGIESEYLERIFKPFERQPAGGAIRGTYAYEGTGLGLPISQRLISKMGGNITVESESGKGSVFTINIPNVECFSGEILEKTNKQIAEFSDFSSSPEVLIVDDVPMNLKVLEAVLKRFKVRVIACNSAKEALKKLNEGVVSLILTDLWMPEMSGEELAKIIKDDPRTNKIPVIAVTADTQAHQNKEFFDGFLLKPISTLTISEILSKYLNLKT